MAKTMPTRIDGELFEAAKAAGALHSRSAAQQLHHWARLGREFESSPAVSTELVGRVLAGDLPYDDAPESAQAVIREEWDRRISPGRDGIDLTEELAARGRPWVEADADGNVVVHEASPAA